MSVESEITKILLAFLVLINPFSVLPLFLELTKHYSRRERRKTATLTTVSVLIAIVFFTLFGSWLLKLFGISIGSFRVGGGILVFLIAISMMSSGNNHAKPEVSFESEGGDASEITLKRSPDTANNVGAVAVVPLAIPMIMGPGGISTVVIYAGTAKDLRDIFAILAAGVIVSLICYVSLLAAGRISSLLGDTGLAILNRIMGMLLAAVAVEIIVTGLKILFPQLAA